MTGTNAGPHGEGTGASPATLWSAAYTYAAIMRELSVEKFDPDRTMGAYFDVPTMLITYALADYAARENLTVTTPADLGQLPGMGLWERLATGRLIDSLSRHSPADRAVAPAAGEPLYDEFERMMHDIARRRDGDGPPLPSEQSPPSGHTGERIWYERGEDGQSFVALALLTYVPEHSRNSGATPLRYVLDAAAAGPAAYKPYQPAQSYEVSEYMAADTPRPDRGDPHWAVRVMQGHLGGRTLLAHYLCSIDDRDPVLPDHQTAPPRPGETAADHTQRTRLANDFAAANVTFADYSRDVADELMHIRPSDGADAVEAIVTIASEWWTATGYEATIDDLLPEMTVLLDGLVAPERRADVQRALDTIAHGNPPLDRARLRIIGSSVDTPYEALHVAAAFGGALYQQPACVPDPLTTFRRFTEANLMLAKGDITGFDAATRRTPPPKTRHTPTSPEDQAKRREAERQLRRKKKRK